MGESVLPGQGMKIFGTGVVLQKAVGVSGEK